MKNAQRFPARSDNLRELLDELSERCDLLELCVAMHAFAPHIGLFGTLAGSILSQPCNCRLNIEPHLLGFSMGVISSPRVFQRSVVLQSCSLVASSGTRTKQRCHKKGERLRNRKYLRSVDTQAHAGAS